MSWTGGQPFLTQKLCKLIIEAEESPLIGKETEWVEELVRSRLITNWESQDEPEHLRTIRDRLLRRQESSKKLLTLYQQILLNPDGIEADDSREQMELRLSGLVIKHENKVRLSNRIYESVFNQDWIWKQLSILAPRSS